MRWPVIVICALLLGVPASAQQEPIAEDAQGDASGQGAAEPLPSPVQGALDLVRLDVEEDAQQFTFHLEVADLADGAGDQFVNYQSQFRHEDERYGILAFRSIAASGGAAYGAYLQTYDEGRDQYTLSQPLTVTVEDNTLSTVVPRDLLRDGNGVPPAPGRALEDFVVQSTSIELGTICIPECLASAWWGDRMPDEGVAERVHDIIYGVKQTGHAFLASEQPFRASNGEATTFVFHVQARNDGEEADRFRFNVSGAPPQWDVRTPASTIKIEGGSSVEVPVVVRTAFAHAHGSATTFLLEMTSLSDPGSVGRLEMGVYYPDPPQPAGHHDTLWLHTRDLSGDPFYMALATALEVGIGAQGLMEAEFMNTREEEETADEVPSDGQSCSLTVGGADYPVGTGYCWNFPLSPGLEMGLDFDLDRKGELDVTIGTELPLPAASMQGELVYLMPVDDPQNPFAFFDRETIVLATINRSAQQDMGALSEATFNLQIDPTEEADLVPYAPGGALELRLRLTTLRPDNFFLGPKTPPPTLEGGARMQLPLLEYEDPVEEAAGFGDDVVLDAITAQERPVNPGKTVLFKAKLQNLGDETHTFRLDLVGSHREWSRLLAPETVRLDAGDETHVPVAVAVPEDAAAGDRADLVLEASSQQDIASRALLRFVAVVSTDEDIPDESEAAGLLEPAPAKKSPAVLWLGLLLALFWTRRRSNR